MGLGWWASGHDGPLWTAMSSAATATTSAALTGAFRRRTGHACWRGLRRTVRQIARVARRSTCGEFQRRAFSISVTWFFARRLIDDHAFERPCAPLVEVQTAGERFDAHLE